MKTYLLLSMSAIILAAGFLTAPSASAAKVDLTFENLDDRYAVEHFDDVCRSNGWRAELGVDGPDAAPGWLQWETAKFRFATVPSTVDQCIGYTPDEPKVEAGIIKSVVKELPLFRGKTHFAVLEKSRDQIRRNYDSWRYSKSKEVFALDFNRVSRHSKALIVIRNRPSKELVKQSRAFIDLVSDTYDIPLHSGGRYGPGIKTTSENGRGKQGVTHLEAFDGSDRELVDRIRSNPDEFACIVASTLGQVPNAVFVAPHTRYSPGASTYDGMSERTFALNYTIPSLLKLKGDR